MMYEMNKDGINILDTVKAYCKNANTTDEILDKIDELYNQKCFSFQVRCLLNDIVCLTSNAAVND